VRRSIRLGLGLSACAIALCLPTPVGASALTLDQVGTYSTPVYVTSDPADSNRLYVVERAGRIMLTRAGQTTTFLDIRPLVPPYGGIDDRGLFSMAFAPDYESSGRFYVAYAGAENVEHLDEFTAKGDSVDPATRRAVLSIDHDSVFHYGGQLQFGPDGLLYVSTGDAGIGAGGEGDPDGNSQSLDTLNGKILRIDPGPSGGQPYTVPGDNPFVGAPGLDEIWSYGLRNPWRFSFDRASGDLVIGDVGQSTWEEVDYEPRSAGGGRGANYGWSCREGPDPYSGCGGDFTEAVFFLPHHAPPCSGSITGGYVVRDPGLPSLLGRYLYADFCLGELRSLRLGLPAASDDRPEGVAVAQPTSFGEDSCGRIYVASLSGPVYRLTEGTPSDCEPPVLIVLGKHRHSLRKGRPVSLKVWSSEAATVKVRVLQGAAKARRGIPSLKAKTVRLAGGVLRGLRWKLGRHATRRYTRMLSRGRRPTIHFRATAADAAGNSGAAVDRNVRLLPGRRSASR
jgi:Glucose / Sorbosone dehydrogenase